MIAFPKKRYQIILADPPWLYHGDPNKDQAAGKHYPMMSLPELGALPVWSITQPRAVCFMWATCPKLDQAVALMDLWGFHFRGVAYVWVKTTKEGKVINGQGTRPTFVKPTTEMVLVGSTLKMGRTFKLLDEGQAQVYMGSRPENVHSRKPAAIRKRIVSLLGPRPRIELFAREATEGWDVWGNEV